MPNTRMQPMQWDIGVHLPTNRYMIRTMAWVMLGASLGGAALLGAVGSLRGRMTPALSEDWGDAGNG